MSTPTGARSARPEGPEEPDAPPGASADSAERAGRPGPAAADAAAVLGSYLALGLVAGVLWWLVVDPARFVLGENGGLGMDEVELGRRFADDGWYAVIGGVLGLLSGAVLTWWRDRDPLLTAGLVLAGSLAAGVLTALVGGLLGPVAPEAAALTAASGEVLSDNLEVAGLVGYLVWPITALGGALLVLWSPAEPSRP